MKYFENSSSFQYTWEQVTQGFWQRYPNPESTHVLSEDTVSRTVKDGKLYTQRLLTKTNRVPKWGERFVPNKVVKIIEESVVDPVGKTLVTYTRNIGLQRVMMVEEKVTYTANSENKNSTCVTRSAWVTSQVYGFSRAIEAFGMDRFKKNCTKMGQGFEFVLARLFPNMAAMAAHDATDKMSSAEKLKDAAKKASDIAKSQANTLFATCTPSEE